MNPNKMILIDDNAYKAGIIDSIEREEPNFGHTNTFRMIVSFKKDYCASPLNLYYKEEKEMDAYFLDIIRQMND